MVVMVQINLFASFGPLIYNDIEVFGRKTNDLIFVFYLLELSDLRKPTEILWNICFLMQFFSLNALNSTTVTFGTID